jgi:hypothetical protein
LIETRIRGGRHLRPKVERRALNLTHQIARVEAGELAVADEQFAVDHHVLHVVGTHALDHVIGERLFVEGGRRAVVEHREIGGGARCRRNRA